MWAEFAKQAGVRPYGLPWKAAVSSFHELAGTDAHPIANGASDPAVAIQIQELAVLAQMRASRCQRKADSDTTPTCLLGARV